VGAHFHTLLVLLRRLGRVLTLNQGLLNDTGRLVRRDGLAPFEWARTRATANRNNCKGYQRRASCIGSYLFHNMGFLFHFTRYRSTEAVTWVTSLLRRSKPRRAAVRR